MKKKKERKRIWVVKAAVVLLVVLALCTAAARTVWNMLLPRVETTTVYGGVLQDQAQLEGTVRYGGQQTVRADGDWEITEILVEEGQTVEEGTPLLRVDTTRLELSVRELELQRETLGHERNRAGTTWSRIEEIDTERALLEDQIGALRAQYPADGVLTAPFAGTVQQIQADAGMRAAAGTELLTLQPADSPRIVEWEMSEEALQRFAGMETIQLYFIADAAGERTYQSAQVTVDSQVYEEDTRQWRLSATLPEEWNRSEISKVQVLLNYESIRYPLIIPAECVTERDSQYYVYTVDTREGAFGDESVVREVQISVLEKNSRQVAAEASGITEGQQLVRYADKPLGDQETVSVVME